MKIIEALKKVKEIQYPQNSPQVIETAADEIKEYIGNNDLKSSAVSKLKEKKGILNIAIVSDKTIERLELANPKEEEYMYFQINDHGSGWLLCSKSYYLFSFVINILENYLNAEINDFRDGKIYTPAFKWQRVSYDYFLTQEGRIQRGLNRKTYIRELARQGFTHIEVNGLAYPMSLETGPPGETYPMFYTYGAALDQFVASSLNEGLYPKFYLSANMRCMKENADLARKYGLTPGIFSYEPRSVPEKFFEIYPMLRGARIDHPFRSFKPRYNMTITHPKVLRHYAEMLQKIMQEIPELGFMSIWTNDSGAGFEHTKSLYVGRNGSAYLVREWNDDETIARLAGENAIRFFRTLLNAGRETNPNFRIMARLESFYGEYETVWNGLSNGIDAETNTLLGRGWAVPYTHPKYPDVKEINGGSVYQQDFKDEEHEYLDQLKSKNSLAHYFFSAGPHSIFEPLMGIPCPFLTHQRLRTLHNNKVTHIAHTGGTCPHELVPFNINHEVSRHFQLNPEIEINKAVTNIVNQWAGGKYAEKVISAWKKAEEAILAFPNITPLYSTHGFTWQRLWVRPLIPNYEAVPEKERAYYENFMCTTPHNPNNVDLSRDVLFHITSPEKCTKIVERMDANLRKPMNEAIDSFGDLLKKAGNDSNESRFFFDQYVRLRGLRCWFVTQHNVAKWIVCVHGYINSGDKQDRKYFAKSLKDMIDSEIANTRELIDLLDTNVEFMAITDKGETPLVHGDNLPSLLNKRNELMEKHKNDEPYIDEDYVMRKAGGTL